MEEHQKVVAITEAKEYSGMSIPKGEGSGGNPQPEVMAEGSPDDDQVVSNVSQVSKAKLSDEDLSMLLLLLQRERDAASARDAHCLKLEKKYGLGGYSWTFDPKSGTIQRTGKRQPEKK